jgi:8-oxo-dGTP pyrophosphatase MutT (NUDIX family)
MLLFKFIWRPWLRLSRGMTLGARVATFDSAGRVLLVKQSYDPHWILPGGGVDRGETIEQAGIRELREEASVIAEAPLRLHGFHSNHASFPGDHVASFVLHRFSRQDWSPSAEITAAQFFDPSHLPNNMNSGSARRIHEIINNLQPDPNW